MLVNDESLRISMMLALRKMSGSFWKTKEAREKCIVKTMSTLNGPKQLHGEFICSREDAALCKLLLKVSIELYLHVHVP